MEYHRVKKKFQLDVHICVTIWLSEVDLWKRSTKWKRKYD